MHARQFPYFRAIARASILVTLGALTLACGDTAPASVKTNEAAKTDAAVFEGEYALMNQGVTVGTMAFAKSTYTIRIGEGIPTNTGDFKYAPDTGRLELHEHSTGQSAVWHVSSLGIGQNQGATKPAADSLRSLDELIDTGGCLTNCVRTATIDDASGCGDGASSSVPSVVCISSADLADASKGADASLSLVRGDSADLIASNSGGGAVEQVCADLKKSIDQLIGSALGNLDSALDEASGVFGDKNVVHIHSLIIMARAKIIKVEELLQKFINAGCEKYYPGYVKEIQNDLKEAEGIIQSLESRLEEKRRNDESKAAAIEVLTVILDGILSGLRNLIPQGI